MTSKEQRTVNREALKHSIDKKNKALKDNKIIRK